MHKYLLLACIGAALAGCASKEKEPQYLTVNPASQIVADVYIRYAGSTHEVKSLGGAAYRQSETIFSLNETEVLDVPVQEKRVITAVSKPTKTKHTASSQVKSRTNFKSGSKSKSVRAKAHSPAPACPPVQVIIKEIRCKECSEPKGE